MVKYDRLDQAFGALADPTRRAMVATLARGEATVSELARAHPMSLPGALKHVRILEAARLVRTRKVGRQRSCRLEPAALDQAARWIESHRAFWERQLDSLDRYLQRPPEENPSWPPPTEPPSPPSKSAESSRPRGSGSTRRSRTRKR
ncbi:MAG: metalloregulator ArsR/SmtB family transcription factor [Gemmatimonadales bacterium]